MKIPTEVGGFGITPAEELLLVEEFALIKQSCSEVTVSFDDESIARHFEQQVDRSRRPDQFARIWIHTHPGDSAVPSRVDDATFLRDFDRCDWAVMFILARGAATHADLVWQRSDGARIRLDVEVDFARPFGGSDVAIWQAEYAQCVHPALYWFAPGAGGTDQPTSDADALEWPASDALGTINPSPSSETS